MQVDILREVFCWMAQYIYRKKIYSQDEIINIVTNLKRENKKIVFTNGCFDILHRGHIRYLRKSRELGEVLIIGLNSDESVRRLKGEKRPINHEKDRAYLLEALEFVDYVVIFNEDTPLKLIQKLQPDYYTKSGDYSIDNVIGPSMGGEIIESYGGQVVIMDLEKGYSTTSIINKSK